LLAKVSTLLNRKHPKTPMLISRPVAAAISGVWNSHPYLIVARNQAGQDILVVLLIYLDRYPLINIPPRCILLTGSSVHLGQEVSQIRPVRRERPSGCSDIINNTTSYQFLAYSPYFEKKRLMRSRCCPCVYLCISPY
jgi:hypothetical protein